MLTHKKLMYIIPHTEEMIARAVKKAEMLGSLNNSITQGKGNAAGYLGEEAVASYLNAEIVSSDEGTNKFNHDLILLDGRSAEVKTKRRTVPPKDFYEVSIAKTSTHQKPDLYIFVSIQFKERNKDGAYKGVKDIWIVGQKTPEAYFDLAELWTKGKIDSTNNFTTHADMYNLAINKLDVL